MYYTYAKQCYVNVALINLQAQNIFCYTAMSPMIMKLFILFILHAFCVAMLLKYLEYLA